MISFFKSSARRVLLALLVYKALFFTAIFTSFQLFPWFEKGGFADFRHWPLEGKPTLASRFATWDGAHYLYLAKFGYQRGDPACAFYPLFPGLIRLLAHLSPLGLFAAGLLLSNVLSILAFFLFHRLITAQYDERTANLALGLLLAFPGAIFFSFIYTESLFFLLAVLFFIFLFQNNYWGVGIVGFLLPLTKGIGIFCLAPLFWHLFSRKRSAVEAALAACGPILGYLCYFFIMNIFTDNPWEGFEAQKSYPNHPSIGNMFEVHETIKSFFNIGSFHQALDSALDRMFFIVFALSLFGIHRMNRTYFAYALFAGAVPALSIRFLSYSRHIMMCFPLFIWLAHSLKPPEKGFILWYIVALLAGIQVYFLVLHINFLWAG